jgi:6-phospho-3-hexuloisomerase
LDTESDKLDLAVEKVLAEVAACVRQVSAESLAWAEALVEAAPRIFAAGAGRSGLGVRALGMRLMHLGKTVYVVGETTTPSLCRV